MSTGRSGSARSSPTTSSPSARNRSTQARPIPDRPPVTTTSRGEALTVRRSGRAVLRGSGRSLGPATPARMAARGAARPAKLERQPRFQRKRETVHDGPLGSRQRRGWPGGDRLQPAEHAVEEWLDLARTAPQCRAAPLPRRSPRGRTGSARQRGPARSAEAAVGSHLHRGSSPRATSTNPRRARGPTTRSVHANVNSRPPPPVRPLIAATTIWRIEANRPSVRGQLERVPFERLPTPQLHQVFEIAVGDEEARRHRWPGRAR